MSKTARLYLEHILESIEAVDSFVLGMDFDAFKESLLVQDAVCRRLEIIGEASSKLDIVYRQANSDVPWREAIGMRNVIIHYYFRVNLQWVWETIRQDLPLFKKQVEALLADQPGP